MKLSALIVWITISRFFLMVKTLRSGRRGLTFNLSGGQKVRFPLPMTNAALTYSL